MALTAVERQRMPGRILVRRRDIEERRSAVCGSSSGIRPSKSTATLDHLGAGRLEREGRALIAGILDRARRAVIEKQPRGDVDAFLRAADDDDAARIGDDAARRRQMIGDRRAQRRQAGRIAVMRRGPPRRRARGWLCSSRRQVLSGNSAAFGRPGKKSNDSRLRLLIDEVRARATAAAASAYATSAPRGARLLRARRRLTGASGRLSADENSRGRPGFDIAFDDQRVVGAHHRVARNRELFRQSPRRRQPRAARECARGGSRRAAARRAGAVSGSRRERSSRTGICMRAKCGPLRLHSLIDPAARS